MKKGLQVLTLSIFLFIPFLVKAAPPPASDAPAVAEGTTSASCDIDSDSIPAIIQYASHCFGSREGFVEPECTINASSYRSYCLESDQESAEACLGRHHCSVPRTAPAPRETPTDTTPTVTTPVATAPAATPPAGPTFAAQSTNPESGGCSFSAALPSNISLGLFASFFLQISGLALWRLRK